MAKKPKYLDLSLEELKVLAKRLGVSLQGNLSRETLIERIRQAYVERARKKRGWTIAWVKIGLTLDYGFAEVKKILVEIYRSPSLSKRLTGKKVASFSLDYPDELDNIRRFVSYIWKFLSRRIIPKVDVVVIALQEYQDGKVVWEAYKAFYTRDESTRLPKTGKLNKLTPRNVTLFISRALP